MDNHPASGPQRVLSTAQHNNDNRTVSSQADVAVHIQHSSNVVVNNIYHYHRQTDVAGPEVNASNNAANGNLVDAAGNATMMEGIEQRFTQLDDAVAETQQQVAGVRADMRYEFAAVRGDLAETGRFIERGPKGTATNPIEVMSDCGTGAIQSFSRTPASTVQSTASTLGTVRSWLQPRGGTAVPNTWASITPTGRESSMSPRRQLQRGIMKLVEEAGGLAPESDQPRPKKRKTGSAVMTLSPKRISFNAKLTSIRADIRQLLEGCDVEFRKVELGGWELDPKLDPKMVESLVKRAERAAVKDHKPEVAAVLHQLYKRALEWPIVMRSIHALLRGGMNQKQTRRYSADVADAMVELDEFRTAHTKDNDNEAMDSYDGDDEDEVSLDESATASIEVIEDSDDLPPLSTFRKRRSEPDVTLSPTNSNPDLNTLRKVLEEAGFAYAKHELVDNTLASAVKKAKKAATKAGNPRVAAVIDNLHQKSLRYAGIKGLLQHTLARTANKYQISMFNLQVAKATTEVDQEQKAKHRESGDEDEEMEESDGGVEVGPKSSSTSSLSSLPSSFDNDHS